MYLGRFLKSGKSVVLNDSVRATAQAEMWEDIPVTHGEVVFRTAKKIIGMLKRPSKDKVVSEPIVDVEAIQEDNLRVITENMELKRQNALLTKSNEAYASEFTSPVMEALERAEKAPVGTHA